MLSNLQTRLARLALFVLISSFCLTSAAAQSTGGAKGKVRNQKDEGIAGATISARQNGVDLKTVKADTKGKFVLNGLDPGIYNLAFEAKGYTAAVQYNVEIKKNTVRDLGDRLILMVDRGSRVIINGSVFSPEGRSVSGAKVEIEKVSSDGSARKLGEAETNYQGEFSFSHPEGPAKFRIKASHKGAKGFKEIDVDSAMIYRLAVAIAMPSMQN